MQSGSIAENKLKKEVIELCISNLIKCVKCDQPCTEGYEAGNLITNNFVIRSKGFLAERFIRPPVTLTFEFKCEIDIKYISVLCKVGAQKSTGIELLSQTHLNNGQFESIGSGVLQDGNTGFVFYKYNEHVKDKFNDQYYFRTFRSSRSVFSVKSVRLKIFRTSGTSVPAIGRIEIWGTSCKPMMSRNGFIQDSQIIARKSSEETVKKIECKFKSIYESSKQKSISSNNCQSLSIPEDFIDPITCEIMLQPVVLPSGKVIDNSTLESYYKAELDWGRGSSDPFTGIPFSDHNKPVAASDLKARIDRFLSNNSAKTELHKIPRIVGKGFFPMLSSQHNIAKPSVSKLVNVNISSCKTQDDNALVTYSENEAVIKRRKVDKNVGCTILDCSQNSQTISSSNQSSSISNNSEMSSGTQCYKYVKVGSFQERMEQSLELSLKSTLSKLPKLTADKNNSAQQTSVFCHLCKINDNLFSMRCDHFVCRSCLVHSKQKEQTKCALCDFSYKTGDVKKVHLV